jgi:flagellar motor protein MotB
MAILTECNGSEIARAAERLRRMAGASKIAWWGDWLPVTISLGGTAVAHGDTVEALVARAERAPRESYHIDMTVTNEGLRIELTESANGTFFDSGSAKISGDGKDLLVTLSRELGKLQNKITLEGHTDSK